jgi:tetratricopeptide (TPR) repeat protein
MPVSLFQRAAAGALAASLLWPQLAAAIDRTAAEAIVRLLEVGWSNSPQARAAADSQVAEVAKLAAGESMAQQAWILVLLQQRRYDEALKRADALIAKDPADTTALRAKIWVATLLKNYEGSMLAAEELSKQLAADPPMNEADQAVHDDLYKFLGRIYGFLGGPIAADVNQGDRKAAEKLIADRIPETRRALFEEARDSVIAKFLEATGAQDDERLKAIAAADAAKDKTVQEIEEERETITDRAGPGRSPFALQGEIRDELAVLRGRPATGAGPGGAGSGPAPSAATCCRMTLKSGDCKLRPIAKRTKTSAGSCYAKPIGSRSLPRASRRT